MGPFPSSVAPPVFATGFDTVAMGYYSNLYIRQGTPQGVFYSVDGTAGSRQVTFEFYEMPVNQPSAIVHFLMIFYEDQPNIVTYKYLNVTGNGAYGSTVGCESQSG